MIECFITATGAYLPGPPVSNTDLPLYLGELEGEAEIRSKILRMNGIKSRHYALNRKQEATHDIYDLGTAAALECLSSTRGNTHTISYLSSGTTNTPLTGPGISSILHDRLSKSRHLTRPVEINSNSGICTASAQALVNCIRAIRSGEHDSALAIGVEQPSEILKSTTILPPEDQHNYRNIQQSKWFMSVFLRSMLSDGAGAFLLSRKPATDQISFRVNWSFSRSFAHTAPLCMSLDAKSRLLSQDIDVLREYMKPCVRKVVSEAFDANEDNLRSYQMVLPHLSSFYFKRYMINTLKEFCGNDPIDYWTNLETAGNTGAASIYIILNEFSKSHSFLDGDRLLLFVPESGQFNYVLISLTVFVP